MFPFWFVMSSCENRGTFLFSTDNLWACCPTINTRMMWEKLNRERVCNTQPRLFITWQALCAHRPIITWFLEVLKDQNKEESVRVTHDNRPEARPDSKTPAWWTHWCHQKRETDRKKAQSQVVDNRPTHRETACDCPSSPGSPQRGAGVYYSASKVICWLMLLEIIQHKRRINCRLWWGPYVRLFMSYNKRLLPDLNLSTYLIIMCCSST